MTVTFVLYIVPASWEDSEFQTSCLPDTEAVTLNCGNLKVPVNIIVGNLKAVPGPGEGVGDLDHLFLDFTGDHRAQSTFWFSDSIRRTPKPNYLATEILSPAPGAKAKPFTALC